MGRGPSPSLALAFRASSESPFPLLVSAVRASVNYNIVAILRLRLHGTGPEPFRTEPDWVGFCLHGNILEPVRNRSKIGPAKRQVQFWIHSGLVPERSRVNRRPIRSDFRTESIWICFEPVLCKLSLRILAAVITSQVRYLSTSTFRNCSCLVTCCHFDYLLPSLHFISRILCKE